MKKSQNINNNIVVLLVSCAEHPLSHRMFKARAACRRSEPAGVNGEEKMEEERPSQKDISSSCSSQNISIPLVLPRFTEHRALSGLFWSELVPRSLQAAVEIRPVLCLTHILLLHHPNVASTNSADWSKRHMLSLLELWILNFQLGSLNDEDWCHIWDMFRSAAERADQRQPHSILDVLSVDKHLHHLRDAESADFVRKVICLQQLQVWNPTLIFSRKSTANIWDCMKLPCFLLKWSFRRGSSKCWDLWRCETRPKIKLLRFFYDLCFDRVCMFSSLSFIYPFYSDTFAQC